MDPSKFIKFAVEISNLPEFIVDEETDCRTGIGRAQYGIFLELRDEIGKKIKQLDSSWFKKYNEYIHGTVKKKERGKIHGIVSGITLECNPHLGNLYRNLREERNKADYNMNVAITKKDLTRAIRLAENIKKDIFLIQNKSLQPRKINRYFI
ncbi:MAG: hypothetical protein ACTSP4_16635 [Candidatus Hodarchaeales archaeon]